MYSNQKLNADELQRLTPNAYKKMDKAPLTLVLDNIRSALNVGSIFRTADAFNVEKIILCGYTAIPPHKEILKAALGATETVAWQHAPDLLPALHSLKEEGIKLIGIEQTRDSVPLHNFKPAQGQRLALILGNEVEGVNNEAIGLCDYCVEIPQFGTKHSLNVAVAAGIVVWDLYSKVLLTHPTSPRAGRV